MAGRPRFSLLRPSDLLSLEFELVNLEVAPDGSRLMRVDPAADALIIVHFPPQGLAEAIFTGEPPAPPVRTVLSGASRLVFRVDADELPFATEALLGWAGLGAGAGADGPAAGDAAFAQYPRSRAGDRGADVGGVPVAADAVP